mgnify:FL=1|jgi:hypothetical protein
MNDEEFVVIPEPDCECGPELDPLPVCEGNLRNAILCAVAHEQTEMARMLKILRCKLCKTVSWLPNAPEEFLDLEERISASNLIEKDIADLIRALAEKENAIANKVRAVMGS